MSRVHAEALVLVNWKGVFYERYELDRHVTALEGDNGAGKTTVMIAAYVVMLPDMTRLRFTNLGETGATGGDKGIWGRLGEEGRPSYTAIDFHVPRTGRVIAGVHLERRAEPTVEPTPFVIEGLDDDVRMQDTFLLRQGELELVPELAELRDHVASLGGRLRVFGSAKDYFASLFDLGVMPMRLGTDEERNKLNEMLKTSMTGGLSRGLLDDLRSFLLKPDDGLADTLQRMRANLDACRRTRTEVTESQRLEREIAAVYEAGERMFAAAVSATRQQAEALTLRVEEAEARTRDARDAARHAEQARIAAEEALEAATRWRARADEALRQAQDTERQVEDALRAAHEVEEADRLLGRAREAHQIAATRRDDAQRALERAEADTERARVDREAAAAGLADFQRGLDELHRRAHAHRRTVAQLEEARRRLGAPLPDDDLTPVRADAFRAELREVDARRRELERRIDDASAHRQEHGEAVEALRTILGPTVDATLQQGRAALEQVSDWRERASRRRGLDADLKRLEVDAERQRRVVDRAAQLGLTWSPGGGREALERALDDTESTLSAQEEQARRAEAEAVGAERARDHHREQIRTLEEHGRRYRALAVLAARVSEAVGAPVRDREALDAARERLRAATAESASRAEQLVSRREVLLEEARALLHAGGRFPGELLALRDELAAELLASRFEDVAVDEAAELEARLGPLAQALVVSDLEAATRAAAKRPATLPTVLLVPEDVPLALDADGATGEADARDVVVDGREARRITRVPERPTLGRSARERRARDLEQEAEALGRQLDRARDDERAARAALADADRLLEGASIWLQGERADDLEQARHDAGEAARLVQDARGRAETWREQADTSRRRRDALRSLLPDAALLDTDDLAARVAALRAEVEAAREASRELARVGDAPTNLSRRLDALRHAPWTRAELAQAETDRRELESRRDALAAGIEALDDVIEHREALAWVDAPRQLEEGQSLEPTLLAQVEQARRRLLEAQSAESAARAARDEAAGAFHAADADFQRALARHEEAVRRFEQCGVEAPTEALLAEARSALEGARHEVLRAEADFRERSHASGLRQAERDRALEGLQKAEADEEEERRRARPAIEGWERMRRRLDEAGLLDAALSDRFEALFGGKGSPNLWVEVATHRSRLEERLRSAQNGPELLEAITKGLVEGDPNTTEGTLRMWLLVRDWLRARLPSRIAEVDDPLQALERFRAELATLEERLRRQEHDLRGASGDVARGIDVQIRKARRRIHRLNQHLEGVRFGSIGAIQVRVSRVDRMEQILEALRSGEAQNLLFGSHLPVEEALEEIFRRYGGGRHGGQRLLDYREYIHLRVEVKRDGSASWEPANPTRLSTGEAIGVGAALMMVVLTEWEHDATLLRGRRAFGSLRLLFLDEANRLDQANLGTLFELCRNLDLQLLVASPAVARAEGCTVFRLVRTRDPDGLEQVVVSGRRVRVAEA